MKSYLFALILTFSSIAMGAQRGLDSKDFEVVGYACYQDSLSALSSAVSETQARALRWCEKLGGQLLPIDSKKLDVTVHQNSPFSGGCPGDVSITARLSCQI